MPDEWADCEWRQGLQVELRVRDRYRRNILCGSHTTSVQVCVASLDEALAAALPLLVARINLRTTGRMLWEPGETLPADPPQEIIPRPVLRVRRPEGRPWPRKAGPWDDVWSEWDELDSED